MEPTTILPDSSYVSKSNRTRIFSGNVIKPQHPTSSNRLTFQEAQKQLETLKRFKSFKDVPFSTLEPVLSWAKPEQLKEIEDSNEHLIEHTDKLWEKFVQKDFKSDQRKGNETWREMHERCKTEKEEKFRKAIEAAKQRRVEAPKDIPMVKIVKSSVQASKPSRPSQVTIKHVDKPVQVITKPAEIKEASEKTSDSDLKAEKRAAPKRKLAPLMAKCLSKMKRR